MADKLKERLRHALLSILLSVGLVMPLCGALDESLLSLQLLYFIAGVILVFELASLHRISAWSAVILAAGGVGLWIFTGNGARILSDAGIAISLRMQGIMTAVPLAAGPVSELIAVGMTLLCCFAVLRNATCIPALMLSAAVIMIVWTTDSMELLPWLLPALTAVLTLVMMYRFEDTPALRILPWAAGLVVAAFLLTGSGPADNALKDKADEIRQSILDRLFFTEARDVYSLYSVGLSPQGADQLGGKPNPSENPVMQVSTPRVVYLRGVIFNEYTGRPSMLYYAEKMTNDLGGAKIYLKREDLNHTGSHKINNALGQALLAKKMGKTRLIAETGAGQHGVATATVAALMGMECEIFMGKTDTERQALNVYRMELLGAKVHPVTSGTKTLKDAVNETFREWVSRIDDTHYVIGSVMGPHPFPTMVRDFQSVISREIKAQILEKEGRLPDAVLACVGGGSNAICRSWCRQTRKRSNNGKRQSWYFPRNEIIFLPE